MNTNNITEQKKTLHENHMENSIKWRESELQSLLSILESHQRALDPERRQTSVTYEVDTLTSAQVIKFITENPDSFELYSTDIDSTVLLKIPRMETDDEIVNRINSAKLMIDRYSTAIAEKSAQLERDKQFLQRTQEENAKIAKMNRNQRKNYFKSLRDGH